MTTKLKNIAIVSIFPEMFSALTSHGIVSKAFKNNQINFKIFNPRDYTCDKHQTVDDTSFGGGAGMVMKYQPIADAINDAKKTFGLDAKVVYLSPQGNTFDHSIAKSYVQCDCLIFLCGRYEGIDQRVIDELVDYELSIGDFVLSGGELPAMVVIDSLVRLIPGVLGNFSSVEQDSFYDGLLDHPHYTKPAVLPNGLAVPDVLLSGDHKKISSWRRREKLKATIERRNDLITKCPCLSKEDKDFIDKYNKDMVSIKE